MVSDQLRPKTPVTLEVLLVCCLPFGLEDKKEMKGRERKWEEIGFWPLTHRAKYSCVVSHCYFTPRYSVSTGAFGQLPKEIVARLYDHKDLTI